MKANRLLRALGEVDSELIEEAVPAEEKAVRRLPRKEICAVCLILAVILGIWIWQGTGAGTGRETALLDNGDTICFVKSDEAGAGNQSLDMDVFSRRLTGEETAGLFGDLAAEAYGYFDRGYDRLVGLEARIGEVKITVTAPGITVSDTVIDGSEQASEVCGIPVMAGYFVTRPNSRGVRTVIYYARFELGGNTVYVENAGGAGEKEAVKDKLASVIRKLIEIGECDLSQIRK